MKSNIYPKWRTYYYSIFIQSKRKRHLLPEKLLRLEGIVSYLAHWCQYILYSAPNEVTLQLRACAEQSRNRVLVFPYDIQLNGSLTVSDFPHRPLNHSLFSIIRHNPSTHL